MRLYSTLSRRLEELPPPPGPIRMYFCGPTVYQRAHIGNARPFVLGMWLRAWLRHRGYEATFVHNITDVNDKIYDAAPGASAELAERATQWYLEDTGDLGLGLPDVLPKATEAIPSIVTFIEKLVAADHAYEASGDVYFSVQTDPGYGRLSGQKVEHMEPEEDSPLKRAPQDFALWKATKPGEDTSWDSPWGKGRPGWHIECSAMAEDAFGPVFEIHGGGLDLVFPHHENELAQSLALGHDFAQIWMHNGLLTLGGEKMSKSLGNDMTIRGVVDDWGREVALVLLLSGHWRKPLDFNQGTLEQSKAQWDKLSSIAVDVGGAPRTTKALVWDDFAAALDNDFNTPDALAVLHAWHAQGEADLLERGLALFGLPRPHRLFRVTLTASLALAGSGEATLEAADIDGPADESVSSIPAQARMLIAQRQAARERRDFGEADSIRNELRARGWSIEDTSAGPSVGRFEPREQFLGNEPPEDVRSLALDWFRAVQLWNDERATLLIRAIHSRDFDVRHLGDGYVIGRRDRIE